MNTTEQIKWIAVAEKLPDSDTTVLIYNAQSDEPVWLGFLDGEVWRHVDATYAFPTHWADIPGGPRV